MLLADIAAEDGDGSDAQRQGEKRLSHSGEDRLAQDEPALPVVNQVAEVGLEVEPQALPRPFQQDGVHRQHHHQDQQAHHHHLVHPLHAVAQALDAHQHADAHHNNHIQRHGAGRTHQLDKLSSHPFGIQAHKVSPEHFDKVVQQPPGDNGVEHHQQVVAGKAHIAVPVPFGTLGLQPLEGQGDAPLAGPAHGQLHHHNRQAQNHQEQQIQQHKGRPAVLPRDVGKAPHVAQSNGAARRDKHKAQAGGKCLSFLHMIAS